jgi:general secretion pathway protein L
MTAVRGSLEKLGAHLAPGIGGFRHWWSRALLSWLPAQWRVLLGCSDARLLLSPAPDAVQVSRCRAGRTVPLQRLVAPVTPAVLESALPAQERGLPRVAVLPATAVLRRRLQLPAAAETRLREVVRFEIDRQTPFSADKVFFDVRVVSRHSDGPLEVELVVAPRQQLETLMSPREAWAGQLDGVDVLDVDGEPLAVNLLPLAQRRQRQQPLRRLNRLLLLAALVMLVLAGWQLLDNRRHAAAALATQVDGLAARARAVSAQRQQLQDLLDGQAFFTQRGTQQVAMTGLLDELSLRLPEDTWVEKLDVENGRLQLIGFSGSASALVPLLEDSPHWKTPALTGVLQSTGGRDRFTLVAELQPPVMETADGAVPHTP